MSDTQSKALQEFLAEGQEIVERLAQDLLSIDAARAAGASVDPDRVNSCFRAVHSLKGLCGLVGLAEMGRLAHELETVLDALRLGRLKAGLSIVDLLFEAVELLSTGLREARDGGDINASDVTGFLSRVAAMERGESVSTPEANDELAGYALEDGILNVLTEYEEHRLRENIKIGQRIFRLLVSFALEKIDVEIEAIKTSLKDHCEIISYLPTGDAEDPMRLEMMILLGSSQPLAALQAAAVHADLEQYELEELAKLDLATSPAEHVRVEPDGDVVSALSAPQEAEAPSTAASELTPDTTGAAARDSELTSLRSVSQSVRVDIRRLDSLMNSVGELGLVYAAMSEALGRMAPHLPAEELREVTREVRTFERKLEELQQGMLEVRMVPLRQVFDRLARVVRKVARKEGKEIRLEIEGADTELDKLIVEELSDPLMHIIRNSIDHGVEAPRDRIIAGKGEIATIQISAEQRGNRVVVKVKDDGRGINEAEVARACVDKGLMSKRAVVELSKRELLNLLFLPGMSTKEETTELSGRGVGLDVVKTNIANLSGIIDLRSDMGSGTEVSITLPITLAIIQAIIVKVRSRQFAIPLNGVVETLMIRRDEIGTIEGKEVISLRNQTLRVARVDEVFDLRGPRNPHLHEELFVVVAGVAQHRLGLIVDELVSQQDLVIKSLGSRLQNTPGIAGATELGYQRSVLVLDIPEIVEEILHGSAREAA